MLCSASTRVAMGGSVTSSWIEFSAMFTQSSTASDCVVCTRVNVRVTVWLLPAASVTVKVMLLSPVASATLGNWKLPAPLAVLSRPWLASVTVAPASAVPCSVTTPAPVWASLPASASTLAMPKLAPVGAWLSKVKTTSSGELLLPAASCATSLSV